MNKKKKKTLIPPLKQFMLEYPPSIWTPKTTARAKGASNDEENHPKANEVIFMTADDIYPLSKQEEKDPNPTTLQEKPDFYTEKNKNKNKTF